MYSQFKKANKVIIKVMNEKQPVTNKSPLKIINTSDISCSHFPECSGCEINSNADKPEVLEDAKAYFASKGITEFSLHVSEVSEWRYRAKLAVRGKAGDVKIGLYKKGTHTVLDIPFCKVHHPSINRAVTEIKKFIELEKIEPYNEHTQKGQLRYIQLVVERATGKVQATFVLNLHSEDSPSKWLNLNSKIWHSIWLNFNTSRTNNIFGNDWTHIKGPPFIFERFGSVEACFHPASFAQANLELFEKMLNAIYEMAPRDSKVVEYFAGVGVIGFKILSKCESVVCCEITEQAKLCFNEAKSILESHLQEKISFETGLSENRLDLLENKDLCIVDPPRKGLDIKLLNKMINSPDLKKIIYVSCGFKAFQRDCDIILQSNLWKIEKAAPYLFFPGSNHIEILALFVKA
jgi:23S rRNA (uracil-5-)-methyltransferase RumA